MNHPNTMAPFPYHARLWSPSMLTKQRALPAGSKSTTMEISSSVASRITCPSSE